MRGVISLFKAITKNWIRNKGGVFFAFIFPLMLLLILGSVMGGWADSTYSLGVQNNDGSPLSNSFVNALDNTGALNVENFDSDEDIMKKLEENQTVSGDRLLIIPENFGKDAMQKQMKVRVEIISETLQKIMSEYGDQLKENELKSISEGLSSLKKFKLGGFGDNVNLILLTGEEEQTSQAVRSIVYSVARHFNNKLISAEEVINVESESKIPKEESGGVYYYLPGLIAAFIMTNGLMQVTTNVSEFRRNGVMKRIAATPLNKKSWIIGNLLHQSILAFLLTLAMIGAAFVFFQITVIPDLFTILLALLGAFTFCGMGLVLGGVIKDVETASAAGSAIAFPMMFLSGAFWPVEIMPSFMQNIAKALPVYYFHEGLRETLIYDAPGNAVVPFMIIGILAVLFVSLAVKFTKWKEL